MNMQKNFAFIKKENTFINALESSPVHWLKSRPSEKRRTPAKAGTEEILDMIDQI
jgi:hypothetical protein